MNPTLRPFCFQIGISALALACTTSVQAATKYWDISNASGLTAGTGNWSTSTGDLFWAISNSPGTTDPTFWTDGNDAIFSSGTHTVTLNGTVNVNSLGTINSSTNASSPTINAGTSPLLIIGSGGISHLGNGTLTINAPVQLGASQTWNAGNLGTSNSINVGGIISDNGFGFGITKLGSNNLTFNGSAVNTYTGATTLGGGGTLTLDFLNLATPANLINSASALNMNGATLSVKGKTGAFNTAQTLGNLTLGLNGGQNNITLNANTGTSTTLTLGDTWTRQAGSTLVITTPTSTAVKSNLATTNGLIGGYAVGTVGSNVGFLTISGGSVAVASTTGLTTSASDATANFAANSAVTHDTGNWAANSMILNGASLDLGGNTLSLTSGGVLSRGTSAGTDVISNGQLGATNSEVIIHQLQSRNLEISGTISGGSGSLTKDGSGRTLILTGNNTYTGNTVVGAGTLQIGNGGTTGSIANSASVIVRPGTSLAGGALLAYNRTDASSVNNLTGGGNLAVNSGQLTLLQSGTTNTLGTVSGVSGATVVFGGDASAVTSLGNASQASTIGYFNVSGLNYKFTSGTVNLLDQARDNIKSNIEVAGGTLNFVNGQFEMTGTLGQTQTLTISSGTLNALAGGGVASLGATGGVSGTNGTVGGIFLGTQTGGALNTGTTQGFALGSATASQVSTYNLSGGTLSSSNTFKLGADLAGTSTTTFNFSGGKLIEKVAISGSQAFASNTSDLMTSNAVNTATVTSTTGLVVGQLVTGTNIAPGTTITAINTTTKVVTLSNAATGTGTNATTFSSAPKQAFVWTGGTLATFAYNATSLTSTAGTTVSLSTNTLTNGGGTLAPGDIGTTGRTSITGNYTVASANAALHIDIAGTNVSTVFQNTPGAGFYDNVLAAANNTTFTLGGKLNVSLLDGFNGNGTFTIINNVRTGGVVTGTFTNTVTDAVNGTQRVVLDNGLSSYEVVYGSQKVDLGSFVADNSWAGLNGDSWTEATNWAAFSPQAAGHIAKFDNNAFGSGTHLVVLDANRTIGGVIFDSSSQNYKISGNTLTLDNNGSASSIQVTQGSHRIDSALALNNNLSVTTTGSTGALTLAGVVAGSGKSLTKTGTGTLTLTGANTYSGGTTVSAGKLLVNNLTGSGTGTGALSIGASATLGGSGFINSVTSIAGTLSPGNSPGILTFNSNVTLQSGSQTYIEITGATTRGTSYDGINFNSGLTIEGGTLTFNISTAIANGSVLNIFDGAALTSGFTSVVSSGTGGYNGFFTFNGSNAYEATFGSQNVSLNLTSGDITFSGSSAIPEPASFAALLGVVTLGFVGLRRRRIRKI